MLILSNKTKEICIIIAYTLALSAEMYATLDTLTCRASCENQVLLIIHDDNVHLSINSASQTQASTVNLKSVYTKSFWKLSADVNRFEGYVAVENIGSSQNHTSKGLY